MLYAKIKNNQIEDIDTIANLFSNVSFPPGEPDLNFLVDNNVFRVIEWIDHDIETKTLIHVEPYIKDGVVYTFNIIDKTSDDLAIYSALKISNLKQKLFNDAQTTLDIFAKTRGYDNIGIACSYFNSTVEQFRNEAAYCIKIRDDMWTLVYDYISKGDFTDKLTLPALSWDGLN